MADLTYELRHEGPRNLLHALRAAWTAWRQRRADRISLARAGRLGPRLLEDMGLTPEQIREVQGGWEHLPPIGFLIRPQ